MQEDETNETNQDTSSGKPGQSSGSKGGSTSKDKGKLYTGAQIKKIESDAAAKAGRERKAAEDERDTLKTSLESTTRRLDALELEQNEARLAEARGDPDKLRAYQQDQDRAKRQRTLDDKEADLTAREAKLKTDRAAVDTDLGVVNVAYVAAQHGLKTEDLEGLGITDQEALEKVAERLAAAGPKGEAEGEGEGEGEEEGAAAAEELSPDSGEGTGAGPKTLTTEGVEKSSMSDIEKALDKAEE